MLAFEPDAIQARWPEKIDHIRIGVARYYSHDLAVS
jgi:hypothetical protein